MKYKVKVIETLEKVVEIEAAGEKEAYEKAEDMWYRCEIILSSPDDVTDHDVYVIKD